MQGYQEKLSLERKYYLFLIVSHPYIHGHRSGYGTGITGRAPRA
jgi:hypothetical protein